MDVLSSFDKSTVSGCNSADLDAAIAQLVYCKALPSFSFGECPYFQRVIDVARSAPRGYKAPKRTLLAGEMLDLAYTTQLERDLKQLMIDADIFGIAFFGDGATIHKCPLINLFASALHCPAVLINIIDCTARCWRNPLGPVPMLEFVRCLTLVSIGPAGPNRLGVTLSLVL